MKNIDEIISEEIMPVVNKLKYIKIKEDVYSAMIDIYNAAEFALDKYQDNDEKEAMACHKGCKTCCRLNVSVLPVETICILEYLKKNLTPEKYDFFYKEINNYYFNCMGLEDEDRIVAGINCIFLTKDGVCSVYPVRPLICRSVTSSSHEKCKESFFSVVFGDEVSILMNIFQKDLMENVFVAIAEILENNGFLSASYNLSYSLRFFYNDDNVFDFLNKRIT